MNDRERPSSPWKRLCILGIPDEEFEAQVARAAGVGATHVDISKLPAKPRHEKTDPTDPYLEYSFILGCLFRYSVPDEVRCMTPAEYESLTRGTLKKRCRALRRHGLRARLWLLEPHALPEEVFEKHPDWRGPRVEFPPRAHRPYYAPCVDHPEVLDLYRRAAAVLLRDCPEIETFRLTTNDSASGICWSFYLYSGQNGPAACKTRPYGERVRGFLQAWLDGAEEAGVDARVLLSPRGMSAEQAADACARQPEGGVVLPTPSGVPNSSAGGGGPTPTIGIWNPISFLNGLANSLGVAEMLISPGCELHWRLLERFVAEPASTLIEKARLLTDIAADLVGPERAEDLVRAWQTLEAALGRINFLPWAGLLFEHGLLSKRWITRPFVSFPDELTEDESGYWRPYLFAASEEEVLDMLNVHAVKVVNGVAQATFIRKNMAAGGDELNVVAAALDDLAGNATSESGHGELRLMAMKLRALAHLYRTVANAVGFQTCMDRARELGPDAGDWPLYWTEGQHARVFITSILRDEMDNAAELADLLDAAPAPLLHTASRAEDEDCFTLPPNVADTLRRKAAAIGRHIVDVDRLFPYPGR